MILKNPINRFYESDQLDGSKKLTVFFAIFCVIDFFGVFPIISLPRSLISCGYYALPLLIIVFSLQIYTAFVLGRCWTIAEKINPKISIKNRYPYAAIADFAFGKRMKILVTILLDLTVFGAGIPNLLVASQNLQLLGLKMSSGSFNFSFCYFLLIIGIFLSPFMWLGSPKNMRLLASISVVICISVAALTWMCVIWETNDSTITPIEIFDPSNPPILNLLKAYGIISFQFDIHPMLLTIQVDMEDRSKIGRAVFSGLLVTISLSVITTMIVYHTYGQGVSANVLESLPRSLMLYTVILLVTLQLCLSSAVGNSALFQHIEDVLGISRNFNIKRCVVRTSLIWFSILIGEMIPKFELVMGVIGGTLTGPLIFILPPLFYTKILKLEKIHDEAMLEINNSNENLIDSLSEANYGSIQMQIIEDDESFISKAVKAIKDLIRSEFLLAIVVIAFGICATFASTFYNLKDFNRFQMWSPCIQNISLSYKIFSM